jgi:N-acetylmuramoyl-L-alanine amidase
MQKIFGTFHARNPAEALLKVSLIFYFLALAFGLSGCATVPRGALSTYSIGGVPYVSLNSLCEAEGMSCDYDTFGRTVHLSKGTHEIDLMIGQKMVLVDGVAEQLKYPVDMYQGAPVIPYKFKEQVLDSLFKGGYAQGAVDLSQSRIRKIIVDAGHGGKDPGTTGRSGLREKDVNLDIAKRLVKLLKADGLKVVMTRSTDNFISLERRADIANDAKADLFVSIHSNANRVRSLNGLEVYYISTNINDYKRALFCVQSEPSGSRELSFAHPAPLSLKATVWDMINTSNRAESIRLARDICKAIETNLNTKVIGIKGAPFYVLKCTLMPSILIESGFLSNSQEERMMKNSSYRQQIAESIEQGIVKYARNYPIMEAARQ